MKYKFQVKIFLSYWDEEVEVEVDLSDEEVSLIRKLVMSNFDEKRGLLHILEDDAPELFDKFWDVIFPHVFVELLINGLENWHIERRDDDGFADYRKADFDTLYEMYGDYIEIEHSSSCFCRIPKEWLP